PIKTFQSLFDFSTRPLEHLDMLTLTSVKLPDKGKPFRTLDTFHPSFWIALVLMLVGVTVAHAAIERSTKKGLNFMWRYVMLLASESLVPNPVLWRQRFISGTLLMFSLVFLTCLSSGIYADLMAAPDT